MYPYNFFWCETSVIVVVLTALAFPGSINAERNVEIITVLPYNLSLAPDVVLTGGAFDLAARSAMQRIGNRNISVSIKHLVDSSLRTCNEISSRTAEILAAYYYTKTNSDTCYAVVTSPCNDQTGIAALARVLSCNSRKNKSDLGLNAVVNLPVSSVCFSVISKNNFYDKSGSPTAVAVGGTFTGYSTVILEILVFYKWSDATILVEEKTVSTFYDDLKNSLLDIAHSVRQRFSLEVYTVSARSNETITTALSFAKRRSRVLVLLTTGQVAVIILEMTSTLGMANGEYVFINVQPLQAVGYGRISQFQLLRNSTSEKSFRALIFIAYRSAGNEQKNLNSEIAERSEALYNVTYNSGSHPLDSYAVQSSYDIVELFATVVSEHSDTRDVDRNCSGRRLAKRMTNRTFHFSTGEMFLGADRVRNLDVNIFGFNSTTRSMQPIGTYNWSTNELVWNNETTIDWPTEDNRPPGNKPFCGFSGEEGLCAARVLYTTVTPLLFVLFFGSMLIICAFSMRWYILRQRSRGLDNQASWRLEDDKFSAKGTSHDYD